MSDVPVIADARGAGSVSATTVVAGLPLVVRHARLAARLGWPRLRVVCDDDERELIAATLARYAIDRSLALEVTGADGLEANAVRLDARGVYDRQRLESAAPGVLAPDVAVHERADLGRARRFLFAQIRKSVALDGAISYYVMRPIGRVLTRVLVDTRISPNHVTLCALACGLTAAVLVGFGGRDNAIVAGLLYWLGGVIDHVDGELARLRLSSSKVGEWLDSMTDETSTFSLLAGLGIGLGRDGHGDLWVMLGVGGAALGALAVGRLYLELHRRRLPIDTAQFPWFFHGDAGGAGAAGDAGAAGADAAARPGLAGKILGVLGALVRRDANVTITAALLIANLRHVAAIAIAVGAGVAFVLTATHFAIVARRGRA